MMLSAQNELKELLIKEQERIEKENKQGYTDRSKRWERIVMRIMNYLYGWDLKDMNDFKPNFPAIDLGDSSRGIGIQVSSVTYPSKIKNTINNMNAKGHNGNSVIEDYPNLYFFFLRFKSRTDKVQRILKESRYPNVEIFDFSSITESFSKLEENEQEGLLKILQEEIIDIPIPQAQVNHEGSFLKGTRNADIKSIDECFKQHNIVYIWGIGEIGKTELAIEWGLKKEREGRTVFLFHYAGSITDTFLSIDFVGLGKNNRGNHFSVDETDEEEQKKKEFTRRINIIRRFYPKAIIILDNFDRDNPDKTWADMCNQEDYKEFCRLPNKILVTTRFYVNKPNQSIQVKELTCDELLLISASYYSPLREEMKCGATNNELQPVFKEIINEAENHTLSIELISKTLEKSEKTPMYFLEQFRKKKLEQLHLHKVNAVHRSSSEGYEEKYERLICHLEILFDIAELHDIAKKVMKYASLLPTSGILYEYFQKCLLLEEVNELTDTLIERSWLRLTVNEPRVISMHSMISVVCRKIEITTEEDIISFLTLLCGKVDIKKITRVYSILLPTL